MPSLKESIENNLAVFFLGALVAGFLSGIAAYETTLRIAGRTTISTEAFKSQELELNKARTAQAAQPPIQRYLTIHRVAGNEGNMVRVVARVNNILYAYPADVAFTPISSNMPEQKLPLPWTIDGYTVSFEVQLRDGKNGTVTTAKSRTTPQFSPLALPSDTQVYRLMSVDKQGMYGSVEKTLSVEYSFR